jgi:hypothetical protein
MSYWYLATPYSHFPGGIELAFDETCRLAAQLVRGGYHVYSPIIHCHPIARAGALETDAQTWAAFNETMMSRAAGCLVGLMPSWDVSVGLRAEVEYFRTNSRPVVGLTWPGLIPSPVDLPPAP